MYTVTGGDRQTDIISSPSFLSVSLVWLCMCVGLSLTDALLSHRLTVQVSETNSKQAGLF